MKKFLGFWALALWMPLQAQWADNFSDGDYTNNPAWSGDVTKFQVNGSQELWLNAPAVANDTAYLSTVSTVMDNASWEFYVRLGFSPSSTNFARVYLAADQANFKLPLNGYFILIGQVTSPVSSREVSLYRQTGTTTTKIISGLTGDFDGIDPLIVRVKVTRDGVGNWELLYDKTGGNTFISMGTANDITHSTSSFSGVRCRFTSTRKDLFWFDDFVVTGTPVVDVTPPTVSGVSVVTNQQIRVVFSEPIQLASATNPLNYQINNGLGNPTSAQIDPQNASAVLLNLSTPIQNSTLYQVSISNVQDLAGNSMANTTLPFALIIPAAGDVVINEIHPDPTPPLGLPEFEFIELYNRTSFPLDLGNWTLTVGTSQRVLPAGLVIQPDSFLVLADPAGNGFFPTGLPIHFMSSWASLTNGGAQLTLTSSGGIQIDQVTYSLDYYNDVARSGGGWSMERKTAGEFCGGPRNWGASNDPAGGTPGRENSNLISQLSPLVLEDVIAEGPTQILASFNKELDVNSIQATDFFIDQGIGSPINATMVGPGQVRMVISSVLNTSTIYNLTLQDTLLACRGQSAALPQTLDFVFYVPEAFDVVVHEIMADESPVVGLPANEWIEIRNRRNFPIPMRNWTLQVGSSTITLPAARLEPDSFLVLMAASFVPSFPNIATLSLNSLPSLTNSSGTLTLRAPNGAFVHSVTYSDSWYGSSAKAAGGWTLEMRDPNNPCGAASNWTASTHPTGGTPGLENSVHGVNPDQTAPLLLRAGLFQPDTAILYFNEAIMPASVNAADFAFHTNASNPVDFRLVEPQLARILVKLPEIPQPGQVYPIWIQGEIKDCAGNTAAMDTVWIGIPEAPEANDIILNEVLSAATGSNVDFVEIYNRSGKMIDLAQIRLGGYDSILVEVTSPRVINDWSLLLAPGEYLVLSPNQNIVKTFYQTQAPRHFWDMSSFVSLAKESGSVGLATVGFEVLDALSYTADFQFSLLNTTDNVSMERILQDQPTQNPRNWTSAAQQVGFATPGYRNSQMGMLAPLSGNFTVEPPIFSPDNDGYQDQLMVQYQLAEPGFLGTVKVFDAAGRQVAILANNELLGMQGFWIWDGVITDGSKARVGVYAITFEIFAPDGRKDFFKKAVTIATKL